MEPILGNRQRQLLILAAVVCVLVLDGHALRTFLSARRYLEAQAHARIAILTSVLQREVALNSTVFSTPEGIARRDAAQAALSDLARRYNFVSIDVLDSRGLLVAAPQSGQPLLVPDNFLGVTADRHQKLFARGEAAVATLGSSNGEFQILALYVPFRCGSAWYALKVMLTDESVARVGQISHDILVYQMLGIGVTVLMLLLIGLWVLRPYRKVLRAARTAGQELLPGESLPRDDNAMMIASFQGVIAKLREKERELVELSRVDRERASVATQMSADILQQMEAAVVQFSSQGRVLQSNRSASEMFHSPPLVLFNQHYQHLLRTEAELLDTVDATVRKGKKVAERQLTSQADGARIFRASVIPVPDPEGKRGALLIISDVTDRARLERLLADKENLAALGEMAGGLAHEVRNSLGTIVGLLRLMPPATSDEESQKFHAMMQKEIQDLNRVVTDFLDFTRPIVVRLDPVDISEELAHCREELLAQFPERARDVSVFGEFHPVAGDDTLLRQAIFNLMKNGLEAGPDVRVTVESEVEAGTGELHLRFRDTGSGISPQDIEKVFIPFYTTKETGYGMGLAIVKKTVLAHAGRISVESEAGEGTTFHVRLPLAGKLVE